MYYIKIAFIYSSFFFKCDLKFYIATKIIGDIHSITPASISIFYLFIDLHFNL